MLMWSFGPLFLQFRHGAWGGRGLLCLSLSVSSSCPKVLSSQIQDIPGVHTRNRKYGFGKIPWIWELGPFGPGKKIRKVRLRHPQLQAESSHEPEF